MNRNRRSVMFTFLIIVFLLLTSCSSPQPTINLPTTSSPVSSDAPTNVPAKVTSDTGAFKVTLISTTTNQPLVNALIRCAVMLKMQGSIQGAYVPSLDLNSSPWGNTDASGTTIISNLKAGKYALAYIFPIGAPQLIKLEGQKDDFSFDITAGKVLDLGTLRVDINPGVIQ